MEEPSGQAKARSVDKQKKGKIMCNQTLLFCLGREGSASESAAAYLLEYADGIVE